MITPGKYDPYDFANRRHIGPSPEEMAEMLRVVGAESLAFDDVSLHETREENGVSRMRAVAALPIAPGKAVELKPGGLHLMLHGPYQPLSAGEKPVITLKLADGRSLPVQFEVRTSSP